MPKSILFVTGTRADFGKLEPLAIAAREAGNNVGFFVTGMHMMERYGLTKLEVQRMSGVSVHQFLNQREGDPQDVILAKTVIAFSDFVAENKPDLVVLHGDRIEALACALVAATNYIRSAHIEGGEVSGTIDEIFRHCNSKLAAHHFVSSENAAARVRALGEPAENIHVIGSPELDFHSRSSGVTMEEVRSHYDIVFDEFGIALFHPVTSEAVNMRDQAHDLFGSLQQSGRNFVVIAPNNDPGSAGIFEAINNLPSSRFHVLPSMRFAYFSELLKNAACMVGNSSAGVREAPFLGLASLDIGTRQTARSYAPSLCNLPASDHEGILAFLSREWGKQYDRNPSFGTGQSALKFAKILNDDGFWNADLQKRFHS